jgi:hypothetical protein
MGPYVPLVSYPVIAKLHHPAQTPALPPAAQCGKLPSGPPGYNATGLSFPSSEVTWPTYWPHSSPSNVPNPLNCTPSTALSTAITFMVTPQTAEVSPACTSSCTDVVAWENQPAIGQAPLPVTIVGTGFGNLPDILPFAVQSSPYIEIRDGGEGPGGSAWDTNSSATCQIYVANWTDTSISLVANLPIEAYNLYLNPGTPSVFLSPLSDVSPLTFFSPNAYNMQGCPVVTGDTLKISVANAQGGGTPASMCALVGAPGAVTCPF